MLPEKILIILRAKRADRTAKMWRERYLFLKNRMDEASGNTDPGMYAKLVLWTRIALTEMLYAYRTREHYVDDFNEAMRPQMIIEKPRAVPFHSEPMRLH